MKRLLFVLALLVPSYCYAQIPPQVGIGDTVEFMFNTVNSSGAPVTIAGTPSIEVYEEGSLTQITAGDTLTEDYDSVTGLHHVQLVCTTGNGYEAGKFYTVVIGGTTPTADSVSILGRTLGNFQCVQTATVDSSGNVAADVVEVSGATAPADNLETAFGNTLAEVSGVPSATDPLWEKVGFLFQALTAGYENTTSNGGEKRYKNAAGTVQWEKDLTDNGTTYTESAAGTPD